VINDKAAAALGITKHFSRRLILYTDIDPEEARPIPALVDQLFDALEAYFGPLPPDRQGTAFQMTGFLMKDKALFRELELLPEELPQFEHGRHRGQEFWLNEQPTSYYRRHLVLHEATHCFMTALPSGLLPHTWYMEGMAEHFGTHLVDQQGLARFRVMPHDRDVFANLGRIRAIADEVKKSGPRPLDEIVGLPPAAFTDTVCYAWSWAACHFLDMHPRHQKQFRRAGGAITSGGNAEPLVELLRAGGQELRQEWLLYAANLCHGYDVERAAITFAKGALLAADSPPHSCQILADRGWQSTGVRLEAGRVYAVSASGRVTLANDPKPWVSGPDGISFKYHQGQPLGRLVGVILADRPADKDAAGSLFDVFPVGAQAQIEPKVAGTLYLRVNDDWNSLADNAGALVALIKLP
jgi:hypothetical protein